MTGDRGCFESRFGFFVSSQEFQNNPGFLFEYALILLQNRAEGVLYAFIG